MANLNHKDNSQRHSQQRRQRSVFSGKKRWVFLPILLVVGFLLFRFGSDLMSFTNQIYEQANSNKRRDADQVLQEKEPISILLTGIDNGALFYEDVEDGRTDVMMIITINPETESATITSVPRDTLGPIGESDDFDKLNHAYMKHGIHATIDSLQRYFDIPIDYYVSVNMQGFIDVIDHLGGIEITPSLTFTQDGAEFEAGKTQVLNGEEAIHYARMRKEDPEGDIGREKRQQEVVEAVIKKVASLGTITKYQDVLDSLDDNIKTDLRLEDMVALQQNYLDALQNLNKLTVQNYLDLNQSFGYYLYIPEEERLRVSNAIRQSLGLSEDSDTRIVYPVEYGVPEEYFSTVDVNGNLIIESEDMPVQPGVYTEAELQAALRDAQREGSQDNVLPGQPGLDEGLESSQPGLELTPPGEDSGQSYGGSVYDQSPIENAPVDEGNVENEAVIDPNQAVGENGEEQ
ncbi:LCP family protein [Aerococcus kribbianus]|uniref:LCP family protein n=1 Tax=Aerococcus kribbianus TaxID=2999064 RepID=A0A9X3JDA6_9LACT|nr:MULTISPECIES: LCP family protein [unclassified Aerococcus]MCZ0717290.1 LCP family protein [Aerococcus sp. YH-aer221]MCZ0725578.1 LCP family protein [Aerococcus sp. YH-aer222]